MNNEMELIKSISQNLGEDNMTAMISIVIIGAIIAVNMKYILKSQLNIMLSPEDDEKKRDVEYYIIFFVMFFLANSIFMSDDIYILSAFIFLIFGTLIIALISKFIKKSDKDTFKSVTIIFITLFPTLVYRGLKLDIKIIIVEIIFAIVQSMMIMMILQTQKPDEIVICKFGSDNKEDSELYIYSKSGEYIICGDDKNIKKASKIIMISLDDVRNQQYYLRYKVNKDGQTKNKSNQK